MCVQMVMTASGIPVRFDDRHEPTFSALRQTLGLPCEELTYTVNQNKPAYRSEPAWEHGRRIERARLKGTLPLAGIDKHCLSPQQKCKVSKTERLVNDSWDFGCGPRFNGRGTSRRNSGRKPEHKNKRAPRITMMLPSICVDISV